MPRPVYSATGQGINHPDFQSKWLQDLFNNPSIEILPFPPDDPKWNGKPLNSLFKITLSHESGIRASVSFRRPCSEPDAIAKLEDCYLVSLGTGVDGRPGRGHGGFTSLLFDQVTGTTAVNAALEEGQDPPATATMTVDYKAPIDTPGVILVRSWMIEQSGRKVWLKGVIEDGKGTVCATAKALFLHPRPKL